MSLHSGSKCSGSLWTPFCGLGLLAQLSSSCVLGSVTHFRSLRSWLVRRAAPGRRACGPDAHAARGTRVATDGIHVRLDEVSEHLQPLSRDERARKQPRMTSATGQPNRAGAIHSNQAIFTTGCVNKNPGVRSAGVESAAGVASYRRKHGARMATPPGIGR